MSNYVPLRCVMLNYEQLPLPFYPSSRFYIFLFFLSFVMHQVQSTYIPSIAFHHIRKESLFCLFSLSPPLPFFPMYQMQSTIVALHLAIKNYLLVFFNAPSAVNLYASHSILLQSITFLPFFPLSFLFLNALNAIYTQYIVLDHIASTHKNLLFPFFPFLLRCFTRGQVARRAYVKPVRVFGIRQSPLSHFRGAAGVVISLKARDASVSHLR